MQRNIGKAFMRIVNYNLREAVGGTQLCAGLQVDCKAAVQAMERIFAGNTEQTSNTTQQWNSLSHYVTHLN